MCFVTVCGVGLSGVRLAGMFWFEEDWDSCCWPVLSAHTAAFRVNKKLYIDLHSLFLSLYSTLVFHLSGLDK